MKGKIITIQTRGGEKRQAMFLDFETVSRAYVLLRIGYAGVYRFSLVDGHGFDPAETWEIAPDDLESLRAFARENGRAIVGLPGDRAPRVLAPKRLNSAQKVDPRQTDLFGDTKRYASQKRS